MKIQVSLITSDYRGDHAADVVIAQDVKYNETVEQMVNRLLVHGTKAAYTDHIEIRVVKESTD